MNTRKVGFWGEREAEKYLRQKGYRTLGRNYACPMGEIDLIMRQDSTVVFVEVKTRDVDGWASPADYVNGPKQRRVFAAAQRWLWEMGEQPYRFDVVEVLTSGGALHSIRHLESAF